MAYSYHRPQQILFFLIINSKKLTACQCVHRSPAGKDPPAPDIGTSPNFIILEGWGGARVLRRV